MTDNETLDIVGGDTVDGAGSEDKEDAEEKYDVDILIHLPEVTNEWWLDEWSDIDIYEDEAVPLKIIKNNGSMV
jgi:hypothetical protein